jgi:chromosome segregation ATPase
MGYLDSRYLARHYKTEIHRDQRMLDTADRTVESLKTQQGTQKTNLEREYNNNQTTLQTKYKAQIASYNNTLSDLESQKAELLKQNSKADTSAIDAQIRQIKNQITSAQTEQSNAENRLKTIKEETENEYQASLYPKEKYWEGLKEFYTEQKGVHTGLYNEAKSAMREALASLFPKQASSTTTT